MGIAAPAVPGAAEAVRQSGRQTVKVIGLSLPNLCKPYVHDGTVQSVVLWNTADLGYLTVYFFYFLVEVSVLKVSICMNGVMFLRFIFLGV